MGRVNELRTWIGDLLVDTQEEVNSFAFDIEEFLSQKLLKAALEEMDAVVWRLDRKEREGLWRVWQGYAQLSCSEVMRDALQWKLSKRRVVVLKQNKRPIRKTLWILIRQNFTIFE